MKRIAIFLPTIEERGSLLETINIIKSNNKYVLKFYIITDTPSRVNEIKYFLTCNGIKNNEFFCTNQKLPGLSGALQLAINTFEEDNFILMASDLETDPSLVESLLKESSNNPNSIICVNRWHPSSKFINYGALKKIFNIIFQLLARYRYGVKINDLTFGYRLYPRETIKNIKLNEKGHAALLEVLLIPIMKKSKLVEIPGNWSPRTEGVSKKNWKNNFVYLKLLILKPKLD